MQTQPELHQTAQRARPQITTRTLVSMAMLCAISIVITYLCRFFPPVAGFLKMDFKDVIIAMGGFLFGPLPAVAISVIVSFIEMITMSSTGPIGLIMNVIATCALVCPAAYLYKKRHSMSGAVVGLVIGVVLMTAAMLLWNYLITPMYMETPRDVVAAMLVPVFLPFNLLKGSLNAVLIVLLYKPVVGALRKAHLAPASHGAAETGEVRRKLGIGHLLVAIIILLSLILLTLVFMGIF